MTTTSDKPASAPPRADNSSIWIIVPAYHEAARLPRVLKQLCRDYPNVVVVDDGSSDETSAVARQFPVWVLRHPINLGAGAALQTGFDFALRHGAEVLVTFDADDQHCADEIPAVIEPIRAGRAEVVLGSRFLGRTIGMPLHRWLVLKLGVIFTRVVSRIHVTDTHNGFKAFSAQALRQMRITQNRMTHCSELLDQIARLRLKFEEVPVTIAYTPETLRKGQSSSNGLRIAAQFLLGKLLP
jgi:glycosyltransferase involved in cell wall biosynthesis